MWFSSLPRQVGTKHAILVAALLLWGYGTFLIIQMVHSEALHSALKAPLVFSSNILEDTAPHNNVTYPMATSAVPAAIGDAPLAPPVVTHVKHVEPLTGSSSISAATPDIFKAPNTGTVAITAEVTRSNVFNFTAETGAHKSFLGTPNSCDKLFGPGSIGKSDHNIPCLKHRVIEWASCELGAAAIDPNKIKSAYGGEDIEAVKGRGEGAERANIDKGGIVVQAAMSDRLMKLLSAKKYLPGLEMKSSDTQAVSNDSRYDIFTTPTLLVRRIDYANPCWAVSSLYSTYVSLRHWKLNLAVNVVWLDGHAKGTFDTVWTRLFGHATHIKHIPAGLYTDVRIINPSSTFNDAGMGHHHVGDTCKDSSDLHAFRKYVLSRYNISHSKGGQRLTLLLRRNHVAHPRSNGFTDRTVADETSAVSVVQR